MPDYEQAEFVDEQTFPRKFWASKHHISERTLSRAIAEGRLHCYRFGRAVRISKSQFDKYLASLEA